MHMVPEAWHLTGTRDFLRKLFESEPSSRLAQGFSAYVNGVPQFLPSVAQYALERKSPLWLVTFYGEPREKHVGAVDDEFEGMGYRQVHALDPTYIDILAVKLPGELGEPDVFGEALGELWKASIHYPRVQQKDASVFRISETGQMTQRSYTDGTATDDELPVADFAFDGEEFVGRAPNELFYLHAVEKFDPTKPEAAYYRTIDGAIPISPVTMAPESDW